MQQLEGTPPVYATTPELDRARDDRVYASKRLDLLTKRTDEIVHAAHACVDDETSSISAVKVEVVKLGAVDIMDDPTGPPPPLRPELRPPEH